jgi:hypothetical protein
MDNKKQYQSPELMLVGATDEVVLGLPFSGDDFRDEYLVGDSEFQADL